MRSDQAQKNPQPGEDEVVSDGGDDVGGIAGGFRR